MKKRFLFVSAAAIMSGSILLSSCIGSFGLTNKVLSWNKTIDSKFVNEVVFIALHIVPVYEITIFADAIVLNSIEFWTGDNPVEAGIVKTVQGENGVYTVETLENGYSIKNEKGENAELIYNKADNSWSLVENSESTKLVKFTGDNNAIVYVNGVEQNVELSANGVLAFRQSVSSPYFAAK
ncbi:DUF3332 domain-containing protein [Viscerimonas tarda]